MNKTADNHLDDWSQKMTRLLSTADGSTFSVCALLYELILSADSEYRVSLFEKAINLYEDIDSDASFAVPVSLYEGQKDNLKELYGDVVNSFIEFFIKQKDTSVTFYSRMWNTIQNDVLFPNEDAKVFAFYYVVIDRRVPYFELEIGYEMTNEAYRKLRHKHASSLKKIRYILNSEFDQKTEKASLLLNELGISIPDNAAGVESINAYEESLIKMVEILNSISKPDFPIEAIVQRIHGKLQN